ncbi:MAG: septum formation initiator family protein [Clostridia bacterium]|nr:septum formation initiator family protein [Clostridia bacterium]MBQ6182914.1 septum formation initiator family protein [Clostridia bacterium]
MQRRAGTNFIVRAAIAFILILLVFAVINIQMKLNTLKQNKKALETQVEEVVDIIDEINVRLDTPVTDEYIERVARDELGYRREGEIIFYNDMAN